MSETSLSTRKDTASTSSPQGIARDLRAEFLGYFNDHEHKVIASAPLVPENDPTLLFTGAGMAPFKPYFLGETKPPHAQLVSAQLCLRAGGKHNDLENVGYTARHHTLFEMLGNFSFGSYFKERAIELAWKFLTGSLGLAPQRMLATVYHNDDDAFALWRKIAGLPESRIIRIATNDNFWSMGDTGPCGPCSEIFYDKGEHLQGGPPGSAEEDGERFMELWNLVFMEFNQINKDERINLPRPCVDTGMGLERVSALLEGKISNFDSSLFAPIMDKQAALCGVAYGENDAAAAHRVVADHMRAICCLIADGVMPENEGRGYVLRRLMRRAMRYGKLLCPTDVLLSRLAPCVIETLLPVKPALAQAQPVIVKAIENEEGRFFGLLDRGVRLLEKYIAGKSAGESIDGAVAFTLYDTYGFPYDLTEDALRRCGMRLERSGYDAAMAAQKARARKSWKGDSPARGKADTLDVPASVFLGYAQSSAPARVLALFSPKGERATNLAQGEKGWIVTDQTPFYAESGGQVGDTGSISSKQALAEVTDTQKWSGGIIAHKVSVQKAVLGPGDLVTLRIDEARRASIRANHSATHLLHAALRRRIGAHVTQRGSMVSDSHLRFDVSHEGAIDPEMLALVERDVNIVIRKNDSTAIRMMPYEKAIKSGALALFGEKYDDQVRVLSMGSFPDQAGYYSQELCGGTHVARTGDIGYFVITGESSIASGVRRIEARTGEGAVQWAGERRRLLDKAARALGVSAQDLPARIEELRKALKTRKKEAGPADMPAFAHKSIQDMTFAHVVLSDVPGSALRAIIESQKTGAVKKVILVASLGKGKVSLAIGVSSDLKERCDASVMVRAATALLGGKGGGRPDYAQGGGSQPEHINAAIAAVEKSLNS